MWQPFQWVWLPRIQFRSFRMRLGLYMALTGSLRIPARIHMASKRHCCVIAPLHPEVQDQPARSREMSFEAIHDQPD